MKKLLILTLLFSTILCGCSTDMNKIEKLESNSVFNTELPEVDISTEVETEIVEIPVPEKVVYTQEKADAISTFLTDSTYADITQITRSSYADIDVFNEVSFNVEVDVANKITFFETINTDNNRVESKSKLLRDEATGLVCEYNYDTSTWHKLDGTVSFINWNTTDMKSTKDVYDYLVKDFTLPIDTTGELIDGYEYYILVEKADESNLSGVSYDSLGDKTTTYIYQQLDGISIPKSVIVEIEYTVGDTNYIITSSIYFNTFSSNTLVLPDYIELQ